MNLNFRVCISSPPDREHLVAEIFLGDDQWAEINQENGCLEVEIYPKPNGQPWSLGLEDMLSITETAKEKLLAS
jgi:hypothetical protein